MVGLPVAFLVGGLSGAIYPGNPWWWRAACLPLAVLGALLLTSYVLRFTADLSGPGWQRTRVRRSVRRVLLYSHPSYLAVMWAVGGVYAVIGLVRWAIAWLS